ncbi:MAG: GNAT family N-acetyltransferase [Firmicutes bacterium]|nr:GNAT family N-acetyltransferase [Bacillota bacterium]
MRVERGSLQDARDIAQLYTVAFPESVALFFENKSPEKRLDLFELTFSLVFHWGIEALLIKDKAGLTRGYCLYSTGQSSRTKAYGKALKVLGKMALRINLSELAKLLQNSALMTISRRRVRVGATPKVAARIVSIAIDPACQGKGLGTFLLAQVLEKLEDQRLALNVRTNNLSARRLYQGAGFQEVGTTKDLQGEWIIMERPPKK